MSHSNEPLLLPERESGSDRRQKLGQGDVVPSCKTRPDLDVTVRVSKGICQHIRDRDQTAVVMQIAKERCDRFTSPRQVDMIHLGKTE